MKESMFNINFTVGDEKYLYNTRNGGIIQIEEEDFNNPESIKYMQDNGYYVNDDFDEVSSVICKVNENLKECLDSLEFTLLLTEECNYDCIYCYQEHKPLSLSYENANIFISEVKEMLYERKYETIKINYFGGEPLLNYELLKHIDNEVKNICIDLDIKYVKCIATNGSLLTKRIVEEIAFDSIQITIEGMKENHEVLRYSSKYDFDHIINNIHSIIPVCPNIIIRINLCCENKGDLLPLIDFLMVEFEEYRDKLSIDMNKMKDFGNGIGFNELDYVEYSQIRLQGSLYLSQHYGKKLAIYGLQLSNCPFLYNISFAIKPDLSVLCCSGDTATKGIFSAQLSKNIKPFRLHDECKACKVMPICLGGCDRLRDSDMTSCIPEKITIKEILNNYIIEQTS